MDSFLPKFLEKFVIQLAKDYNCQIDDLDAKDLKFIAEHIQAIDVQQIQQVVLPNGRKFRFQMIVSGHPGSARDVAVIKVHVRHTSTLKLANYNNVNILDRIIVAGYPALPEDIDNPIYPIPSFTDGIVSAKKMLNRLPILQISAPVTHGNSGGPVMNEEGEVVGMVTFGSDTSGFNFAVPSDTIIQFLQQAVGNTNYL